MTDSYLIKFWKSQHHSFTVYNNHFWIYYKVLTKQPFESETSFLNKHQVVKEKYKQLSPSNTSLYLKYVPLSILDKYQILR